VSNRWQSKLTKLLEEKNTLHNTAAALREAPRVSSSIDVDSDFEKTEILQTLTPKTPKTPLRALNFPENSQKPAPKTPKTTSGCKDEASELGLIAMWSIEFGYISVHDPTTGEWYDVPTKEAPSWTMWEARKRKELYRDGNRKAYRLTSREMEKIWGDEHLLEPEGIVEDHPVEEEEVEE
jgi:hypothetical protein